MRLVDYKVRVSEVLVESPSLMDLRTLIRRGWEDRGGDRGEAVCMGLMGSVLARLGLVKENNMSCMH